MTAYRLTSQDLAPFYRNSIGLDSVMMNVFDRIHSANNGHYPPYNIITREDDTYCIELATAGFTQDEVSVTIENNQLIITGSSTKDTPNIYMYQGISSKDFIRTFALAEHVEVKSATMEDGILSIDLERIVPENLKPKEINIKYKK